MQIHSFAIFVVLIVLFVLAVGYVMSWLERPDDEADT